MYFLLLKKASLVITNRSCNRPGHHCTSVSSKFLSLVAVSQIIDRSSSDLNQIIDQSTFNGCSESDHGSHLIRSKADH